MNDRVIAAKGYLWTTVEEAVLRQHYSTSGPERCAELLPHRGLGAVYGKARKLGLEAPQAISTTVGTPTAIVVQMKRQQIDRTDPDSRSATDLGPLLGVNPATVADWIARRGLIARKVTHGHTGRYVITRRALRAWLLENHGFVDLRKVDQPWFWGLVLGGEDA